MGRGTGSRARRPVAGSGGPAPTTGPQVLTLRCDEVEHLGDLTLAAIAAVAAGGEVVGWERRADAYETGELEVLVPDGDGPGFLARLDRAVTDGWLEVDAVARYDPDLVADEAAVQRLRATVRSWGRVGLLEDSRPATPVAGDERRREGDRAFWAAQFWDLLAREDREQAYLRARQAGR